MKKSIILLMCMAFCATSFVKNTVTATNSPVSNIEFRPLKKNASIQFDGLYIAKTNEIPVGEQSMTFFTYLRFYPDGTVYAQTVNSFAPEKVAKWFGKEGRFEKMGTYTVDGDQLNFIIDNDLSPDKAIEGPLSNEFMGQIVNNKSIELTIKNNNSENQGPFLFEFSAIK